MPRSPHTMVIATCLGVSATVVCPLVGAGCGKWAGGGTAGEEAAVEPGIRWVGRVDARNPGAVRFSWQGAGLVAIVRGASIAVKLRTEGESAVFFQPVIDGKPGERFDVPSGGDRTVSLGSGLRSGDHRVELYRDTEGASGVSTFLGFVEGTVRGAPASKGRRIEVVGDSISAGYGNLGSEPHPNWVAAPACHWTAANSSWFKTYAAIAGRALGAEVSTIARSGWGMYRDLGGDTRGVLPSIYDRALGAGDPTPWSFEPKVSAVVINLGTNDYGKGDPGPGYETAYIAFVEKVRARHPAAWILLTIGSMTQEPTLTSVRKRLESVVAARARAGDTRLVAFDMGVQNLGSDGTLPTGCDWHPNAADHERMARILEAQLRTTLGW